MNVDEYKAKVYYLSSPTLKVIQLLLERYVLGEPGLSAYHAVARGQVDWLAQAMDNDIYTGRLYIGKHRLSDQIGPPQVMGLDDLFIEARNHLSNAGFIFLEDFIYVNTYLPEWV